METKTGTSKPEDLSAKYNDFLLYFVRTRVESIAPRPTTGTTHLWTEEGVVTVQDEEHVSRVFHKLVTEGILSVPVLNTHRQYIATLDMLDLVIYVSQLFENIGADWSEEGWSRFLQSERKFIEARVRDVLELPRFKKPSAYPLYAGVSLLQALELFANTDLHRIPVLTRNGRITGILTQSMMISLLQQNKHMLTELLQEPVRNLEPFLSPVALTVRESDKAIEAFKKMAEENVSGVAVVNSLGELIDTVSIRDLRGIGTNAAKWRRLALSVAEFKRLARADFARQTPEQPLYVKPTDTLDSVLKLMDDGNIHRIWECEVIESQGLGLGGQQAGLGQQAPQTTPETQQGRRLKPLRPISQGDFLSYLVRRCGVAGFGGGVPKPEAAQSQSQSQQEKGSSVVQPQAGGAPPSSVM
jgi:CBS domain-containing protein